MGGRMDMERRAEMFERFADALPFGVLMVERDWVTLCWNKRAEEITGYPRHQVLGRKCHELLLFDCERTNAVCGSKGCPLQCRGRTVGAADLEFSHKEGHTLRLMAELAPLGEGNEKNCPVGLIFHEKSTSREMRLWTTQAQAQRQDEFGLPSVMESREELRLAMPRAGTAVMLMELENSEQMARHFGRELVHTVLRRLIQSVSHLVAFPHFLGHWNDERLLLLVPNCAGENLEQLVRALETASAGYGIRWWGDRIAPRIRVGAVSTEESESAEKALERLETSFEVVKRERE
jgi:PAS domain S-box-containing protein